VSEIRPGGESDAKAMNSDLGFRHREKPGRSAHPEQDARFVEYAVKSAFVTLTAEVNSQLKRDRAGKIANAVPNVRQVVNDLPVKDQKASSSQY